MIYYKTAEEIELIRECSLLVSKTLAEIAKILRPGIKTIELDRIAEEFIRSNKAEPAFKGYKNYGHTLCVSVNEEVVHGLPGKRELKSGDIVSVDCGVKKNGFLSDTAYTFLLGEVSEKAQKVAVAAKEALFLGISKAVVGNRVGDISHTIQRYIEKEKNYHLVRELVGHGIGKDLHEDPEVPNYGRRGSGVVLKEGLVIAIEPMVNIGTQKVVQEDDGWTIRTADKSLSAHYELMVALRKNMEADKLSVFTFVEIEEARNNELIPVKIFNEILAN